MSKTYRKNSKKTSNSHFEDGYHSKQYSTASENRKKLKHLETALRSRDLRKILAYEDHL